MIMEDSDHHKKHMTAWNVTVRLECSLFIKIFLPFTHYNRHVNLEARGPHAARLTFPIIIHGVRPQMSQF
jgi:hypothetical protein